VGQSHRSCGPLADSVQAPPGRLDRENHACARTSQFRRAHARQRQGLRSLSAATSAKTSPAAGRARPGRDLDRPGHQRRRTASRQRARATIAGGSVTGHRDDQPGDPGYLAVPNVTIGGPGGAASAPRTPRSRTCAALVETQQSPGLQRPRFGTTVESSIRPPLAGRGDGTALRRSLAEHDLPEYTSTGVSARIGPR
jgi:hypothetical protein